MKRKNEKPKNNAQVKSFSSVNFWEQWLAENHLKSDGLWLQIFKKDSGVATVTYDEALDVALCYGWIDGQKEKYDEISWLQKFTPRRSKSIWSKRNREHVARLISAGKMKPSGLKEVEAAKMDGRWDNAYDSSKNMQIPSDFFKELMQNEKAYEFFKSLNKTNIYAIAWRLQTAKKPETRKKRMKQLLEMMASSKKLH